MKYPCVCIGITCWSLTVGAVPFGFDETTEDVREFVVQSVTNCIRNATIALMHERIDEVLRPEDALMPWYYGPELGFRIRRCVVMLKGEHTLSENEVCYLYETPRQANVLPTQYFVAGGPTAFCYFDGNRIDMSKAVWLTGRKKWLYDPPYDPYASYMDEFVQLMLLTPEFRLDKSRIKPNKYHYGHGTVVELIGVDYARSEPEELMAKLKIEQVFSNRVFRMNEGCAFQVDYPMPDMDWRGLGNKSDHLEKLKGIQAGNTVLMHLSREEVSEIVYLAFIVDSKDQKEYDAAVRRCPNALCPVSSCRTSIGRRLQAALREGGLMPVHAETTR